MVGRKIKRNRGLKGYHFNQAHKRSQDAAVFEKKVPVTTETKAEVIGRLEDDRSPEQISGRLKGETRPSVSHEISCRFILDDRRQTANGTGVSGSAKTQRPSRTNSKPRHY
ncbi:MAG: hypothetical protein ONA69_10005 [candidate division KSB1 bacterium]|nr:hypothetical protein [candidate division KSB1 bacterium]